jgi:hypothetical protein
MSKLETVTIRVDPKTKAALDMIAAERGLVIGKNVTQSEAIWYLVQVGAEHIAERVEALASGQTQKGDERKK